MSDISDTDELPIFSRTETIQNFREKRIEILKRQQEKTKQELEYYDMLRIFR